MLISKNRPSHNLSELSRYLFSRDKNLIIEFEKEFARQVNSTFGIVFPYCRVAIEAILKSVEMDGDKVLLPAYTCVVVAHALEMAHKQAKFCDVDAISYNALPEMLLDEINSEVGAIIPTYMYGTPFDMRQLEVSISRPMLVIEDGSLGLHPSYCYKNDLIKGVSVYSFGANKILSTINGGIVVTRDEKIAHAIRTYRDKNIQQESFRSWFEKTIELFTLEFLFGPEMYSFLDLLRNNAYLKKYFDTRSIEKPEFPVSAKSAFSDKQASLGLSQLKNKDQFIARRRQIAQKYHDALRKIPGINLMTMIPESHFSHFALRIKERDARQVRETFKKHGIEVGRTLDYSLPELPIYKKYAHKVFSVSKEISNEVINLPNYPHLTDKQVEYIINAAQKILA